jgi:hypothetical protein
VADEIRADLLLGRDTLSPALVKAGKAASDTSSDVRQLTRDLYELGKKRATPVVDLQDKDATAKLADVTAKLKELGARIADPKVAVDDKKAQAALAEMRVKLDALGKRVASPRITLEGLTRAEAGILRLDAMLDGLDRKHAEATVGTRRGILGRLGGLFGGAAAGGPQGLGTGLAGLGGAGPYAAGAAALGGALLAPAAIPAAAGLGIGGLGAFLAAPKAITKAFKDMVAALHTVLHPLQPLFAGIFTPLAGFVRSIGPQLRDMFRASVPFLKAFVGFLEQATKDLLPAFTQLLKNFVSSGALSQISKGLIIIVRGFAGFLNALGPSGMQASAKIFVFLAKVMAAALTGLGHAINWLAENVPKWVHDIAKWWDWLRHHTANVFDGIRHDIAHYWDTIYQNSIGRVIRLGHDIEAAFNDTKHFFEVWVARIEVLFGGWAKNILHYAQDAFGWLPGFLPGVSSLKRGLDAAQKDLASFVGGAKATLARLTGKDYGLNFVVKLPPGVGRADVRARVRGAGYASGTTGAAPGWAMVGERGPELMHFKGGETVIPNHALRGYAGGTGGVVVHLSAPSIKQMAAVLGAYVAGIVRTIQSKYVVNVAGGPAGGRGAASLYQVERYWTAAGGPGGLIAHIAAAITGAESGFRPGAIQQGQPYATTGWGLWQITPGDSEPQAGVNYQLLNPYRNAIAAVAKYRQAGNSFAPWTTYMDGAYLQFMDRGGWLRPGMNHVWNGTGRPEQVLPAGHAGGGITYNITVQVGHGTHPAAAAREIADVLNEGARSGVRLRRSLIGANG